MCRSLLRPAVFSSDRHADSRRGQRYHCEVERHRYIREVYGHGEQWSGCEAESRCGRHKYLDHNEYCGKYRGHGNPEAKWTRRAGQVCGCFRHADHCGVCDVRHSALDRRTLTDRQRHRRGVFGDLQLRDEPQRDIQIVQQLHPFRGAVRAAVDLELHVQHAADRLDAGCDRAESICGEVHCDGLPVRLGLSVVQVRDF
ncbi:hypothetical protein BL1093 [Bifidobacterium longum NCC2705]|uniref:Uncharacterized protein n=1 Tax=Bifidobacterium longum (strain NCC 2705) TaxID=206672 RepID=Q8G5C1_BIFLO|nr:hypothetical protein BL1093 [Bifidobacterium longum NCC2705]